jgi:hypothetical protein
MTNPFEGICLIVATKAGRTLRFERKGVSNTYASVRRLRALGWTAGVLMPGQWA